jgi:methylmalonyl-CoA mutase
VRIVTAAALFDGHDAAINVIRRVLQAHGAEVIHLGHDRSVTEVVAAAVEEDADGVAVSSYQGGHMEYFTYLVSELRARGAPEVRVYGGGGGVISSEEAAALEARGVARVFGTEAGRALGLDGMAEWILADCASHRTLPALDLDALTPSSPRAVARALRFMQDAPEGTASIAAARRTLASRGRGRAPVIGLTGTGGAGKSSLLDELLRRFRHAFAERTAAVLLIDPSRRRTGGALLGDRLRLCAIDPPHTFVHSMATRRAHLAVSATAADAIAVLQAAAYDWIFVETAGIGQSDSEIVDLADVSVYVMSPEFGAASQLEKIDMLELADLVVVNKCDRRGAEDALRDVRRQRRRSMGQGGTGASRGTHEAAEDEGVFGTIASLWTDPGLDDVFAALVDRVACAGQRRGAASWAPSEVGEIALASVAHRAELRSAGAAAPLGTRIVPDGRERYLAEICTAVREYGARAFEDAERARDVAALARVLGVSPGAPVPPGARGPDGAALDPALVARYERALRAMPDALLATLRAWPETRGRYAAATQTYRVRDRQIPVTNHHETLSGVNLPVVALPKTDDWGELARYLALENLPGTFPFTAGVFSFKRTDSEEPTRMFAGEGTPERTNRRFHLLAAGRPAARLSTAFDSVTLYGRDPDERPDVWGKIGTSGVSVCTIDDAKKLYSGFDLAAPTTSVSMTINGPAPVVLALFLSAAIDQAIEKHLAAEGALERTVAVYWAGHPDHARPQYAGPRPAGHDGLGLALLGISGDAVVAPDVYARIQSDVLRRIRGTVQADILKEDQAQNTCIFSTPFALRLMGDVQEYFCKAGVDFFYSVSISGYHMAEAGASPITQLAFTLANAFTYVEYYLARGLAIDDFAPNLSFFFSNGLDAEYSVIGRVARRIFAIAMRDVYGASERSQKLKYHVQTSGRSLHAREMAWNDVRTTMQAWLALADHCNSLHTNAFDEAVTTPTEASVRRALAIQLILTRELGVLRNENPMQGAYLIDELSDLVEARVLEELLRLSARGGVLGAMETMYQRHTIQEESLRYERKKHSGELPVIGVNTFLSDAPEPEVATDARVRGSEEERRAQVEALRAFHARHAAGAPAALERLQRAALRGDALFPELLSVVRVASLGQVVRALFQVGGQYRRAM